MQSFARPKSSFNLPRNCLKLLIPFSQSGTNVPVKCQELFVHKINAKYTSVVRFFRQFSPAQTNVVMQFFPDRPPPCQGRKRRHLNLLEELFSFLSVRGKEKIFRPWDFSSLSFWRSNYSISFQQTDTRRRRRRRRRSRWVFIYGKNDEQCTIPNYILYIHTKKRRLGLVFYI